MQLHSGIRLSKKSLDFSTAFKNAVTFAPHSGAKVLAPLAGSLAQQGFQGIRFHARRAAAPSRSPAPVQADAFKLRFFDTLTPECTCIPAFLYISGRSRFSDF